MADPKSDTTSVTERFRGALEAAKPATGGVPLADLLAEVMPLLPLLTELPAEKRAAGNFGSFEFRECFTVLTLVGRRLALLDLTPTTAIQVTRLALQSVDPRNEAGVERFAQHAVAAAVEGFVLGREERVSQLALKRAASCLKPLRIDGSIFALIISGAHEPAVLSDTVDALGRAMLEADVELAIVDLTQLDEPNRERAIAVFAADEIAKMLGGQCVFTGVDARWRAAATDARIPLDAMQTAANLAEALAAARNSADRDAKERTPSWRAHLRRLLR
ncbi:MAG: hypothetical protein OEN21_12270 [Myxococcales bacterium]|nr:hypothetical protein [Myxococcales bacterium]